MYKTKCTYKTIDFLSRETLLKFVQQHIFPETRQ